MRVYVVQHGEAVAKEVDPARPLSEKGRLDAERLAAFLARIGVRVQRLIHSGKTRARQTAELVQWAVLPGGRAQEHPGLGPEDPVAPLADEIGAGEQDVMIVGHQPFVGRLVGRLVADDETRSVAGFVPGTVVCLERSVDGWQVIWMVRPEVLAREE